MFNYTNGNRAEVNLISWQNFLSTKDCLNF